MKLFIKKDCSKCDYLKPYLSDKVSVFDIDTMEGLKELEKYSLVMLVCKAIPILIKDNGVVIVGAIPIKKELLK